MPEVVVVLFNLITVSVSFYIFYLAYDLYRKYDFDKTSYFLISAGSLVLWNISHLIHNFMPDTAYIAARGLWFVTVALAMVFLQSAIFGFLSLRYLVKEWKTILYVVFFTGYFMIFILKPSWIDVGYSGIEGWTTEVKVDIAWSSFAIIAFLIVLYEILIPLIITSRYADKKTKRQIYVVMFSVLITISSSFILSTLIKIGLPQVLRFLVVNLGFLIFFLSINRQPFIGFYNPTSLHKLILATHEDKTENSKFTKLHSENVVQDKLLLSKLNNHKHLLHPIRLAIVQKLVANPIISREELRKSLDINSGTLNFHIKILENQQLIETVDEFIDNNQRKMIYTNPLVANQLQDFLSVLNNLIN